MSLEVVRDWVTSTEVVLTVLVIIIICLWREPHPFRSRVMPF